MTRVGHHKKRRFWRRFAPHAVASGTPLRRHMGAFGAHMGLPTQGRSTRVFLPIRRQPGSRTAGAGIPHRRCYRGASHGRRLVWCPDPWEGLPAHRLAPAQPSFGTCYRFCPMPVTIRPEAGIPHAADGCAGRCKVARRSAHYLACGTVLALGYQYTHHYGADSFVPSHGVAIPARPLVTDGARVAEGPVRRLSPVPVDVPAAVLQGGGRREAAI